MSPGGACCSLEALASPAGAAVRAVAVSLLGPPRGGPAGQWPGAPSHCRTRECMGVPPPGAAPPCDQGQSPGLRDPGSSLLSPVISFTFPLRLSLTAIAIPAILSSPLFANPCSTHDINYTFKYTDSNLTLPAPASVRISSLIPNRVSSYAYPFLVLPLPP